MMLKALLLAHFSSALLLKYQIIINQARAKFAQKIPTKSENWQNRNFSDCFPGKLAPRILLNPCEIG